MRWEKVKIEALCIKVTSGGTPKTSNSSYYEPAEIPWLKTAEVKDCRILETENFISKKGLENSSAKFIPANCVIVAMYGETAARVAINKIALTTNQACCNLIIDAAKADYNFVYYALVYSYESLVALKFGGAQQNLNAAIIKNYEIPLPDLPTQKRIASILSAYDDLIEVNRKQIKLLEEAAERLYRDWFIDLHFPGHENTPIIDGLPQGWKKGKLGDVIGYDIGGGWGSETRETSDSKPAYVIRGTDFHCVTDGSITTIPYRFHTESNLKSRLLQDGDIIFEVSGGSKTEGAARTVYVTNALLQQLNAPAICASFCKLVRAKERSFAKYLFDTFQYLRKTDQTRKFDKYSAGNIVNYRWQDFLNQQMIIIPESALLKEYTKIVENLYENIQTLAKQISQAQSARDLLLPKLMNGEINL